MSDILTPSEIIDYAIINPAMVVYGCYTDIDELGGVIEKLHKENAPATYWIKTCAVIGNACLGAIAGLIGESLLTNVQAKKFASITNRKVLYAIAKKDGDALVDFYGYVASSFRHSYVDEKNRQEVIDAIYDLVKVDGNKKKWFKLLSNEDLNKLNQECIRRSLKRLEDVEGEGIEADRFSVKYLREAEQILGTTHPFYTDALCSIGARTLEHDFCQYSRRCRINREKEFRSLNPPAIIMIHEVRQICDLHMRTVLSSKAVCEKYEPEKLLHIYSMAQTALDKCFLVSYNEGEIDGQRRLIYNGKAPNVKALTDFLEFIHDETGYEDGEDGEYVMKELIYSKHIL